jgi:hypothetical protein
MPVAEVQPRIWIEGDGKQRAHAWFLLAAIAIGCSGSTGTAVHLIPSEAKPKDAATEPMDACVSDEACRRGAIIQPTQFDAAFDFSGPDIIQSSRPATQDELGPPRTFDLGCDKCEAFCDRDRCVNKGRGGLAYLGGTLGLECLERGDPAAQADPKLALTCNGFVCTNHVCVSCRTDAECCPLPGDGGTSPCVPGPQGDEICLWWERIGSNYCFTPNGLKTIGLHIPEP